MLGERYVQLRPTAGFPQPLTTLLAHPGDETVSPRMRLHALSPAAQPGCNAPAFALDLESLAVVRARESQLNFQARTRRHQFRVIVIGLNTAQRLRMHLADGH